MRTTTAGWMSYLSTAATGLHLVRSRITHSTTITGMEHSPTLRLGAAWTLTCMEWVWLSRTTTTVVSTMSLSQPSTVTSCSITKETTASVMLRPLPAFAMQTSEPALHGSIMTGTASSIYSLQTMCN